MNQFLEWVARFFSSVNLYQPTEPQSCRFALHLLRGKAAEMAKNIPQQVPMNNLQELLTGLDKLFNTTGNWVVTLNIFNPFMPVVAIRQRKSPFFKMTIKSKPYINYIQTFLNMFPIYWSNSDKKRLVSAEEPSE